MALTSVQRSFSADSVKMLLGTAHHIMYVTHQTSTWNHQATHPSQINPQAQTSHLDQHELSVQGLARTHHQVSHQTQLQTIQSHQLNNLNISENCVLKQLEKEQKPAQVQINNQ
jgi:hypothetical protein